MTDLKPAAASKSRLAISALAIVALIDTIGGVAVRNLIGWWAFGILSGLIVIASAIALIRLKPASLRWHNLPKSLLAFLGFAILSISWSVYRPESALGTFIQLATTLVAVFLAFSLTWDEFFKALATSLRYLLLGSLLFELIISIFVRHPVYIWWVDAPAAGEKPLKLLMWSRDQLFDLGPIQGLFGNSVLLGFTALLGLIVFGLQLANKDVRLFKGWFWIGLSTLLLALTRSATVGVALIITAVALGFALWARKLGETPAGYRSRTPLYATATAIILAGLAAVTFARGFLFGLLGKSSDLTGRIETWQKVIELAQQKPWFGWGWISYWAPWVEPFKSLDTKNHIQVMHAHNAWLDVWLQVGIVGLVIFALLVISTFWRSWFTAVDRPRRFVNETLPYQATALTPFLIMVALIVQSLTESRLLVEGGFMLLALIAIITNQHLLSSTSKQAQESKIAS